MQRLRRKLTYSNVVSSLCLVLVLGGGTAFAASQLKKNSVGSKQLKSNAVTGPKIKSGAVNGEKVEDGSLTGADIKSSTLGTVPSAATAATAGTATIATTADAAKTAGFATSAKSAETAASAATAASATTAKTADSATSADTAKSADSATFAKEAETAQLAKQVAGQRATSLFIPESENGVPFAQAGPFTITAICFTNTGGEEIARFSIGTSAKNSAMDDGNSGNVKSFDPGTEPDLFELKDPAGTVDIQVGDKTGLTAIAPSGEGVAVSNETLGFEIAGHTDECFFSAVVNEITPPR